MSTSIPKLDDDPDSRTRDIALAPDQIVNAKAAIAYLGVLAVDNTEVRLMVGNLSKFKSKPQTPKPNPNDPRDKFCYDSLANGKSLAWIRNEINEKWQDQITTESGISEAAKRYAKRRHLKWPIQH